MQSEIDDIRLACKVLEILNSSEKGLSREDVADGIRSIRESLDLIEAQQAVHSDPRIDGEPSSSAPGAGCVNLPVMTLAMIARAAVRERVGHGKPGLTVIEGGRHG